MKQFDEMMAYFKDKNLNSMNTEHLTMLAMDLAMVAMVRTAEQLTRIADALEELVRITKYNTAKYTDDMR